jgi:hypothetical protein
LPLSKQNAASPAAQQATALVVLGCGCGAAGRFLTATVLLGADTYAMGGVAVFLLKDMAQRHNSPLHSRASDGGFLGVRMYCAGQLMPLPGFGADRAIT